MNHRLQLYSSGIAIEDSDDLPALFEKPCEELDPDSRVAIAKAQLAKAEEWVRKLDAFDALLAACKYAAARLHDNVYVGVRETLLNAITLAEPKK